MKSLIGLLSAFFLLSSSLTLSAQTKRAFVIGLGEQQDRNWAKINGDKDVPYVRAMLERAGYSEIDTLVNEQATKKGIVDGFRNLAEKCGNGDIVYIHFSGHGQQVTDVSGDEEDGWDEAWIPYDAFLGYDEQKYWGQNHLLDDEINVLLTDIKEKTGSDGALLVVVDACHSASSTSGSDIGGAVRGADALHRFKIPFKERGSDKRNAEQWLTLSACNQSYQQNNELKDPAVGCLSYALCVVTENADKEGTDVAYDDIVAFVHGKIGTKQTPKLTKGKNVKYDLSIFFK